MTSCATCRLPNPPVRLAVAHVGVPFGDHERGRWVIRLDGQDVTADCLEARPPLWVVLLDRPTVVCSGDHLRSTLRVGCVEVEGPVFPRGVPQTPAVFCFFSPPEPQEADQAPPGKEAMHLQAGGRSAGKSSTIGDQGSG